MEYHAATTPEVSEAEVEAGRKVRSLAGECVVIMKNDGALPFDNPGKIALFGNGARHTIKGGTGSGDVNSRFVVNIEQGLSEAGFDVTTGSWLDRFDESYDSHMKSYMENITRISEEKGITPVMVMFENTPGVPPIPEITGEDSEGVDTAIYVLSRDSGEGGDRRAAPGDFYLKDDEKSAFEYITTHFRKSILLLNVGGIVSLGEYLDRFSSVVLLSQLGNLTGHIAADVLIGRTDPSGRLTDSWCFDYSKYPNAGNFSINNGNTDDEYYTEGVYVGYRYFDSFNIKPDFPFGYGLGYTTFDYSVDSIETSGLTVRLNVRVRNTGSRAGKQVIQFYAAAPHELLDKPFKELVGYVKTGSIEPGEELSVSYAVDLSVIASYCSDCESKVLEPGDYILMSGINSEDVRAEAVLVINERITTEKLRNNFGNSSVEDEYANPGIAETPETEGLPRIVIDAAGIKPRETLYTDVREEYKDNHPGEYLTFDDVIEGKVTVFDLVAQLEVSEMAALCVGDYGADSLQSINVVGSASVKVPGAAAETISSFTDSRKIPSMVLADGPAGLRLQPHFKTTKEGEKIPGGEVFGLQYNPFPEDVPSDAVDYYQYCTAIPIATALAQSFNTDLIASMGDIVGSEMKRFFVHFWLAPGMNIHRNPLCGRNFEYYSEDPFVSGKCAAAMTRGVQAYGGQGTTIKHFCCNNQEINRMYSNSHVSERAIRNLYLRGFEIAVKESQPYSVMTSYNLINGIHSANHYGLCQNVLRDEWGFDGIVMTDWYTSQETDFGDSARAKYECSSSVECIRSGNDWQMPGCEKNVTDIIEAVNNGSLPKADLQFCTANVIRMAVKCFSNGRDI